VLQLRHAVAMNRRFVLLALPAVALLTAAAPALRVRPAPAPLPDLVRVVLSTELGPIELELDHKHAPVTVENFVRYVDQRRFDGIVFYRAMRLTWGEQPNGLIQTGARGDPKRVLRAIAHEPTSQTGILHKAGTLSMARYAPGTATGDFSIMVSDQPSLDADPTASDPERRAGYAAFGRVTGGMDVVRKIFDAPINPALGDGVMKGQMLARPVRVISARRVAKPVAPPPAPN
jgi:peptidyl-prolyl cis-trans isomerase A (cyclophilin A)